MARDVEADVNINDKSSKGLSSFLASLKRAKDEVKSTSQETDKATAATAKMGGKADENAKAFHKLSSELEISKRELGSLAQAFANAGTAAERSDISKAMRKQQTEIRNLTKNRDILKDLLPSSGEVDKETQKLTARLKQSFEQVSAAAPQIIGGGIAAAAPLAASLLSAGIIGGVGLGGIIGGVTLAAKDARVQAAFAGMKERIGQQLSTASTPFISTTLGGIHDIENTLHGIDFARIFAKSAQNAQPLIFGVTNAVRELSGGIEDVIDRSGPVFDQLGDSIADLGQDAGQFLSTVSYGSTGAAAGLRDVTNTLGGVLDVLGPTTLGLTTLYGWLSKIGVTEQFVAGLLGPIGQLGDALDKTGIFGGNASGSLTLVQKGITDAGVAATVAAPQMDSFATSLEDAYTAAYNLFDSRTQAAASIDAVTASIKNNGTSLDVNTVKGRANRDAISRVAQALNDQYKGYVDLHGPGAAANEIAKQNQVEFDKAARKFHLSADGVKALRTQVGLIPPKKSIELVANTHDAAARIEALREKAEAAARTRQINFIVRASVSDKVANTLARFGGGFAEGGSFDAASAIAGDGIRRSGGASRVQVDNTLTNNVYLDGKLLYSAVERIVDEKIARSNHRQKVGRR
ncbi:hypothetical protein [Actinoplanes sp. NPDC051411]|uniref:hypothetical protein n=1 Tax=Actinoplanes sp. NPDC051411 TaxID=3155522 RepID=UPI00343A204E